MHVIPAEITKYVCSQIQGCLNTGTDIISTQVYRQPQAMSLWDMVEEEEKEEVYCSSKSHLCLNRT
jgi:hypothetical protein